MHIHALDLEMKHIISISEMHLLQHRVKSACCFHMRKDGKVFDFMQTSKAHKNSLDIFTVF